MQRLATAITPRNSRLTSRVIAILATGFAGLSVATAFPSPAVAQLVVTNCGDGLVGAGEIGAGTLMLKSTTPGCYIPAPSVATDITVDVAGPVARSRVTQRFENPADGWVEGVYLFPLPEGAAVDTLKMVIGERLVEGQIKERREARQIYEAARAEGKRASLVEQERPNIFTNWVANIGPREAIVVQIEYQESLRFDHGRYHLRVPLVVAPRYAPAPTMSPVRYQSGETQRTLSDPVPDRHQLAVPVLRSEFGKVNPVSLLVRLESGFPLGTVESDSHAISVVRDGDSAAVISLDQSEVASDRDFTLHFAPAPGVAPTVSLLRESSGGSDYVLAFVVPPATRSPEQVRPREVVFVLDSSGSMAGESIRQAKASLLLALDRLSPADRFNVIRFDNTMTDLFAASVEASPQNVSYAKNFVAHIDANGGTEMLPALLAALADPTPLDQTRLRQVIFLTDGAVGNETQLFAAIGERLGRSRLFTVGIGSAPNAYFMGGAARAGRGAYTYIGAIDQVAPRMAELFIKLEHPVMTDLTVHWPDARNGEIWPNPLPDLYAGEPVLVTAKLSETEGTLVFSGRLERAQWQTTLDLSHARPARGIEKLWARNKIAALDESRVRGVDPTRIDKAILEIALEHHLASRLTSLVAVDVTASRPVDAALASAQIPLNLPAGWDFGNVFGKTVRDMERHAETVVPLTLMTNLSVNDVPMAALEPRDTGLVLPQGGTNTMLMLFAGLASLMLALVLLFHWRRIDPAMRP